MIMMRKISMISRNKIHFQDYFYAITLLMMIIIIGEMIFKKIQDYFYAITLPSAIVFVFLLLLFLLATSIRGAVCMVIFLYFYGFHNFQMFFVFL